LRPEFIQYNNLVRGKLTVKCDRFRSFVSSKGNEYYVC